MSFMEKTLNINMLAPVLPSKLGNTRVTLTSEVGDVDDVTFQFIVFSRLAAAAAEKIYNEKH